MCVIRQLWWLRRLKLFFLKSILFSCDIHFILKSYSFYFHVIFILFSCHTHFIFMSYSFYFHVIVILKIFQKIISYRLENKMHMTSVMAHEAHTKSFHIDLKTKCIWHQLNLKLKFFRLEPFEPRRFHFILKCIWHGRGSKGSRYC